MAGKLRRRSCPLLLLVLALCLIILLHWSASRASVEKKTVIYAKAFTQSEHFLPETGNEMTDLAARSTVSVGTRWTSEVAENLPLSGVSSGPESIRSVRSERRRLEFQSRTESGESRRNYRGSHYIRMGISTKPRREPARSRDLGGFSESELLPSNSSGSVTNSTTPVVLIRGDFTMRSENRTFELGFFSPPGGSGWFLGIWYAGILIRTCVWVANREMPVSDLAGAAVVLLPESGRLVVMESTGRVVWQSDNSERAVKVALLDTGNLVLLGPTGTRVWQSFNMPTDTWLPDMPITAIQRITCWRSSANPAPGLYSLRLHPPVYGEFVLEWRGQRVYWTSGLWNNGSFSAVPEMTVPYIYKFRFEKPFTPEAYFVYSEPNADFRPLSRFTVHSSGVIRQYTWSSQTRDWNMFWSRPEDPCSVYAICGSLGVCTDDGAYICNCLPGFEPAHPPSWAAGDHSSGCRRLSDTEDGDGFISLTSTIPVSAGLGGVVSFTSPTAVSCRTFCLKNLSCIAASHDMSTGWCQNLFGALLNLVNSTAAWEAVSVLYVRVPSEYATLRDSHNGDGVGEKPPPSLLVGLVVGLSGGVLVVFALVVLQVVILRRRRCSGKPWEGAGEEDEVVEVRGLKSFSYGELHEATRGFSEKLGHGAFGVVFRGDLADSTPVAVKRFERRPGSGDKEFRTEVCTIGSIQHINLVRLRGFCTENSDRLLVYDYMANGSLSSYLRQDVEQILDWKTRFSVAVGTARALAYLHEGCRDCIIHCDVKPENILLDADFMAKLSDFGLAKLVGREFSRVLTTMRGTRGYLAPEWISGVAITAKADVYSYGMTLVEIIAGRRISASLAGAEGEAGQDAGGTGNDEVEEAEERWFFPAWAARQIICGNVGAVVDPRLAGTCDMEEVARVGLVAVWCIQDEESERPAMGTVVKMLDGTIEVSVPQPPKSLQALVADTTAGAEMSGGTSIVGIVGSSSSE